MTAKFRNLLVTAGATITLLAGLGTISPVMAQPKPLTPPCRTYAETGKNLCGRFMEYWDTHGGLMQQGYPISNEMQEKSDTDGKTYTVQYFERAVFELHPENKAPYDVLLSLLGSVRLKEKYPNGAPEQPAQANPGAGMTFPQTGKTINGLFMEYWKSHGGLAQQGYPITNLVTERSEIDGKEYTVQYFERAVFEAHPEKQAPYNVLLSLLGTIQYQKKYLGGGGQPANTLALGTYGGDHLSLDVQADVIKVEFDCGHGTLNGPIVVNNGQFQVMGTYVQEHGGPSSGQEETPRQAMYSGSVSGNTLTIKVVVLASTSGGDAARELGTYTVSLGKQAKLVKCL